VTHFWKWLALSTAFAALAYGALIGLTAFVLPWNPAQFDTAVVNSTERGWVNEARYFVLNRKAFAEADDDIVIIGASNARDPFRPDLMEADLTGWDVSNASLSGAMIDEVADAVDLYYLAKDAGSDGRTVFVIALNYLQFVPPNRPEGADNPLATEAMRGGLFERSEGRLRPLYPRPVERTVEAVFRPQALVASLPRRAFRAVFVNPDLPAVKNLVDRFRDDDPLSRWTETIGEHPDLDALNVPPDVQQALLEQRLAGMGGDRALPPDGFRSLAELIARIRSRGDAVVILDLPLPEWHLAGVPLADASYRSGVEAVVARHPRDEADFLSLRAFNDPDNFFDSAHAKPRLWPVMSRRLAEMLAASPTLGESAPAASAGSHD
jgi:hypothetical protein